MFGHIMWSNIFNEVSILIEQSLNMKCSFFIWIRIEASITGFDLLTLKELNWALIWLVYVYHDPRLSAKLWILFLKEEIYLNRTVVRKIDLTRNFMSDVKLFSHFESRKKMNDGLLELFVLAVTCNDVT